MINAILISIVSMLCYISAEMVYPLVPLYLTTILGTTPVVVGLIEGIANSFSALLKFYSGYYADKKERKRKLLFIGYSGALINCLILIFTNSWVGVLTGRITDRFSKAIRTPPRDVLVAQSVKNKTVAFGLNEALNALGASIGILIAYFLVYHAVSINYKRIFIIAMIPVLLSLIVLSFLKKEEIRGVINVDLKRLGKNLKLFLGIAFFSSLGNSTKSLLLLKASSMGYSAAHIILLYLLINIANFVIAFPIGLIARKINMKHLLVSSYLIFAIVYLGLGISSNDVVVILLFILYGFYLSMISVSSRTFVTDNAPVDMKTTALGLCNALVSFASLPATLICGILWSVVSPNAAFLYSGIIGLISVLLMVVFVRENDYIKKD